MSWLSEQTRVFEALKERLKARETAVAQSLILSNVITPVTSIDDLLATYRTRLHLQTVDPGAVGWYVILAVPTGKRYTISRYRIQRTGGTGLLSTQVALVSQNEPTGLLILETYTATTDRLGVWSPPLILDAGQVIQAYISAYAGGDTMDVYYYFKDEERG